MKPKRDLRPEIDKVRKASGLPTYEAPLNPATCAKCKRTFYFRNIPKVCCWPGCEGKLQ